MKKKCGRERGKIGEKSKIFVQNILTFGVKLSRSPFSGEIKFIMQENRLKTLLMLTLHKH